MLVLAAGVILSSMLLRLNGLLFALSPRLPSHSPFISYFTLKYKICKKNSQPSRDSHFIFLFCCRILCTCLQFQPHIWTSCPLPGAWRELSVVVVPSSRIGSDATNTAGGSGTTLITTTFTFESRNFVEKISKCQDGSRHSENQLYSYCIHIVLKSRWQLQQCHSYLQL